MTNELLRRLNYIFGGNEDIELTVELEGKAKAGFGSVFEQRIADRILTIESSPIDHQKYTNGDHIELNELFDMEKEASLWEGIDFIQWLKTGYGRAKNKEISAVRAFHPINLFDGGSLLQQLSDKIILAERLNYTWATRLKEAAFKWLTRQGFNSIEIDFDVQLWRLIRRICSKDDPLIPITILNYLAPIFEDNKLMQSFNNDLLEQISLALNGSSVGGAVPLQIIEKLIAADAERVSFLGEALLFAWIQSVSDLSGVEERMECWWHFSRKHESNLKIWFHIDPSTSLNKIRKVEEFIGLQASKTSSIAMRANSLFGQAPDEYGQVRSWAKELWPVSKEIPPRLLSKVP